MHAVSCVLFKIKQHEFSILIKGEFNWLPKIKQDKQKQTDVIENITGKEMHVAKKTLLPNHKVMQL